MKAVFTLAVLACVAACALASYNGADSYDRYNRDGFRRVGNGIRAAYANDERQRAVNRRAEYVGASSGTAKYYDVPGTDRDFGYGYNRGYYGGRGGNYGGRGGNYGGYNDNYYGGVY